MSTKIYNGYKLPKMSIEELDAFCKQLQKRIVQERSRLIQSLYPDYAKKWMKLYEFWRETVAKKISNPLVDFGFDVVFFPHEVGTLALTFTEQHIFTSVWQEMPEVEDYAYFDNTDPPEGVDYEEFELRGQHWEEVLGGDGYGIPSQCGFTFTITGEELPLPERVK